jgi:serine/threonine protein kinase/tetratricopeptide (TPR) repeat protein
MATAESEDARSFPPGTQLGHFRLLALLGSGGMGEVYRALDLQLEREVAVKVLPSRIAQDPEALARFEREAKAVAALSHPHILAIHDYGASDGVCYAVMELLEGETLRGRLARSGLAWRKAAEVGAAVAEALAAAHAKGLVHRDLKPPNIFLTQDGQVKVLDFGLVRWQPMGFLGGPAAELQEQTRSAAAVSETLPGTVMGTVGYMAPEQVRGEPADARSDIFALGCVLHEMLTGRNPFGRGTAAETMAAILNEDAPPPSDSGKAIPAELDRLVRHCLEKNADERFQSARDLAFDLRQIATGSEAALARRVPSTRLRRALKWAVPPVLLAGLWAAYVGTRPPAMTSLAVLPFVNATGDPEAEYLSDGLTESVIRNLSLLPQLRVMARGTVFTYKGREVDPRAVGRELRVDTVLTGRISRRGGALLVSTELVRSADGSQIWGEQYNRPVEDLLAVQEELSREISEKLPLRLSGEDKERMARGQTESREAYHLLLKGRFHANKRSEEGLRKAIQLYEEAIGIDPTYALAYSGLADCHQLLAVYSMVPPREGMPKAKAAALKALELDDRLAEAHTSLAYIKLSFDWDWPGAQQSFQRAIEINPNYATAHHWYAEYFTIVGRPEGAMEQIRRAQELDPLSLPIQRDIAWHHYFARRYDDAIDQLRKTLELSPDYAPAFTLLGRAHEQKGEYEPAVAAFERALALRDSPVLRTFLGHAYAVSGRRAEALAVMAQVEAASKQRRVDPYYLAAVWTALGDHDRAFEALEQAYQERFYLVAYLNVDPRLDPLRGDPRFQRLLKQVGL